MYDPISDMWEQIADLDSGRVGHTANAVLGKIYAIGGDLQPPIVRSVEEYNPNANTWNKIIETPIVMTVYTASVFDNKIYTFSGSLTGIFPNLTPTSDVYCFDPSLGCVTIDFESVLGDTVTEGLLITDQFFDSLGISFELETNDFPRIAEVGPPITAFESSYGSDTPAPGQNTGSFFLTDDGLTSGTYSPPLIVSFEFPLDSANGYVLDLDADETFTIEARDSEEQILEELVIAAGDPGTGDGIATLWSFKRDSADIYSIRYEGTRTAGGFFGLGFDNFCTCAPMRITSVDKDDKHILIESYLLEQNYPNPFNPSTTIEYGIPERTFVELMIYDILGREVLQLVNEEKDTGYYEINFNAYRFSSGIYFYQIRVGDFIETKKMVLMK